jgi:hypothetical protein
MIKSQSWLIQKLNLKEAYQYFVVNKKKKIKNFPFKLRYIFILL